MSTAKEKYQEFKKQYEEARKQLNGQATDAFKEFASDIFAKFPGLESFGWTQYTPYFNDGDACEFSVNADYESGLYINGSSEDYGDEDEDDADLECSKCGRYLEPGTGFCPSCGTAVPEPAEVVPEFGLEEESKARKEIVLMMRNFADEILEDIYGDHVKVTIHRNGKADIDEYSHD